MITSPSSARRPRSGSPASLVRSGVPLLTILLVLAGCSDNGLLEPTRPTAPLAGRFTAEVVETPNYAAYDRRAEFDGAGIVAHASDFEQFTGGLLYVQPTPWTFNGITYTSSPNVVLGPGVGLGVPSNGMATEFGGQLAGEFAASDAFTLFGADLTLVNARAPVSLVVTTNVASYTFANLDIPLSTSGNRFFGIGLSQPGEYLTGFRFTNPAGATVLMDNIAVGHVANANTAPVASAGGPYSGTEGAPVSLTLSATDVDDDALTYSWDLGDGTTGSGATPPTNHVYADNGAYDIVLAVEDGRGGVDTARTTATVTNVAPTVAAFAVPTAPIALSAGVATVAVSAGYVDPGSDTHVVTLDCGTGASARSEAPNGTARGTCTFTSAGVYAVQLTVHDDDGDSDTEVAAGQVVVYDASAGWITGGGWIDSPVGAYAPAASVSGKLTFGFVAKYQTSSVSIPNGNAEFKLSLARLDFRSSTLDWMVVTGSTAHLQGSGTLNGTGDYGFSIAANDGSAADAIRIRIWNRVTGDLVYDNKFDAPADSEALTPLGGGSIQIHSR